MLDIDDRVENQVDGQINSFEEFLVGYSSNNNQYLILIIAYCITYLSPLIRLSFHILHALFEEDLLGELSNSDLLEFTYQEDHKLSIMKSI